MEKDEARLNYFKELRESGLTKLFEEDVRIFFGGIVSSTRNPMNKEKLLEFYQKNKFQRFSTRKTADASEDSHELIQLFRFLK